MKHGYEMAGAARHITMFFSIVVLVESILYMLSVEHGCISMAIGLGHCVCVGGGAATGRKTIGDFDLTWESAVV